MNLTSYKSGEKIDIKKKWHEFSNEIFFIFNNNSKYIC